LPDVWALLGRGYDLHADRALAEGAEANAHRLGGSMNLPEPGWLLMGWINSMAGECAMWDLGKPYVWGSRKTGSSALEHPMEKGAPVPGQGRSLSADLGVSRGARETRLTGKEKGVPIWRRGRRG
jgi:hypothetical protein